MSLSSIAVRTVPRPVQRAFKNDFVRHGALVFAASMATNILNYLFNFAISRRLGVEGFATLSSLVSGVMILSVPATITTLIVVKYAAAFHAAEDAGRIRRLSSILLKGSFFCAVGVIVIGEVIRGFVASFLRIPNTGAITLAMAVTALSFVTPVLRAVLQGEQDFVRYSASLVIESLLKVTFAVTLVYAGFQVGGAMLGWVLGMSCGLVYTVWAVLAKHGKTSPPVKLSLNLRELLRTTTGVALASGFLTTISFMHVLLVKHYFDPKEAGFYAAVNLSGKIVLFLVGFVPAIVLPKAVAKAQRGESAVRLLAQAGVLTVVMSGITLAVFGLMPAKILTIVAGHAFVSAAPYVFQYDGAMALLALLTLIVNYNIGVHRFEFLYCLGVVLLGEIGAIALWHRDISDVIHVLLVGNAIAIVGCVLWVRKSKKPAQVIRA
jgi:O-antigen/teichoic acid export membrane protein